MFFPEKHLPDKKSARFLRALLFFSLLFLWSSPGYAGVCTSMAKAPRADIKDPNVQKVLQVWKKVNSPFFAMTGRQTAVTVLSKDATYNGRALPPTGHICPGAPPVVYVTWPMVDLLYVQKKYPEDFLAFVFGHELGHRINDLSVSGSLLGADERPGTGNRAEALADKRAAFFGATAGYSMRNLGKKEIVSNFLAHEVNVRKFAVDERKTVLTNTLHTFDAYEDLYEASIAMSMAGEREAAVRLLGRADELISSDGIPLPEIKILRAIVLMNDAATAAPWTKPFTGRLALGDLRCTPIFPTHSALWEEPSDGVVRGGLDTKEAQRKALAKLKLAKRLLNQAEEYGTNAMVLTNARGCLAFYMAEFDDAKKQFGRVSKMFDKKTPKALKQALAANNALLAFGEFSTKNPVPAQSQIKESRTWVKKLKRAHKSFKANSYVFAEARRLLKYPDVPRVEQVFTPTKKCKRKNKKPTAPSMLAHNKKLGFCPKGWRLLHTLPAMTEANKAGSSLGVTTCVPYETQSKGYRDKFVHIELPGAMEPKLARLSISLVLRDYVDPKQRYSESDWTCGCESVMTQGVSDLGDAVKLGVCTTKNLMAGLLYSTPQGKIARLVVFQADRLEPRKGATKKKKAQIIHDQPRSIGGAFFGAFFLGGFN